LLDRAAVCRGDKDDAAAIHNFANEVVAIPVYDKCIIVLKSPVTPEKHALEKIEVSLCALHVNLIAEVEKFPS